MMMQYRTSLYIHEFTAWPIWSSVADGQKVALSGLTEPVSA
jgi:hypothetical protein